MNKSIDENLLADIDREARKPGQRRWVQQTVPALVANARRLLVEAEEWRARALEYDADAQRLDGRAMQWRTELDAAKKQIQELKDSVAGLTVAARAALGYFDSARMCGNDLSELAEPLRRALGDDHE